MRASLQEGLWPHRERHRHFSHHPSVKADSPVSSRSDLVLTVRLSNPAVRECDQQKGVILPIIGAQGPCNDPLTVELPIAPSASCDPVWRYRGGIAAVTLQVGGCVAAVCPFSLGGGLLEGLLGEKVLPPCQRRHPGACSPLPHTPAFDLPAGCRSPVWSLQDRRR